MDNTLLNKILVHRIIIGEPDKVIQSYLSTWSNLPFNWNIVVWDQRKINQLLEEYYPEYIQYIKNIPTFGQLTDFYRYLIVHNCGGMWVDWDITLNDINKLKEFVEQNPQGYVVYSDEWLSLCCEHFFLPIRSLFLEKVIETIISIFKNGSVGEGAFYTTGGIMLRQVFYESEYNHTVIPSQEIFSHNYKEMRTNKEGKDKALTHYWTNSWERNPIQGPINREHIF